MGRPPTSLRPVHDRGNNRENEFHHLRHPLGPVSHGTPRAPSKLRSTTLDRIVLRSSSLQRGRGSYSNFLNLNLQTGHTPASHGNASSRHAQGSALAGEVGVAGKSRANVFTRPTSIEPPTCYTNWPPKLHRIVPTELGYFSATSIRSSRPRARQGRFTCPTSDSSRPTPPTRPPALHSHEPRRSRSSIPFRDLIVT